MAVNKYLRPQAFRRLIIWVSRLSKDADTSPTITGGDGAPTEAEPDGSVWLQQNGDALTTLYARISGAWVAIFGGEGALISDIDDPGDGNAIPVTASGNISLVTGGAETRTLADPPAGSIGREIALSLDTDGGDCVLTAANPVNQAGNNTLLFDAVGETVVLKVIEIAGAPKWRIIGIDGVTPSTV